MTTRQLEVETRIPGGLLGTPERLILEFPLEETISIRDLIRLKVEEEARRLAAMETLEQPSTHTIGREYRDLEEIDVVASDHSLDISAEIHKAQQAFAAGRFLILANGQRYTQLDEQVALTSQTKIKFIRLMPLTGGKGISNFKFQIQDCF